MSGIIDHFKDESYVKKVQLKIYYNKSLNELVKYLINILNCDIIPIKLNKFKDDIIMKVINVTLLLIKSYDCFLIIAVILYLKIDTI